MAQGNGPIIGMSVLGLSTVALGVTTWMFASSNSQNASQLDAQKATVTERDGQLRDSNAEIARLKELIGRPGAETGEGDTAEETINGGITKLLTETAEDGTSVPANLEGAVLNLANARDTERFAAQNRQLNLNAKVLQMQQEMQQKDQEIANHRTAREQAEDQLRRQEAAHSEQMKQLETQISDLRTQTNDLQAQFSAYQAQARREIADLEADINQKNTALVRLRNELRQAADLSFERADGAITFVDRERDLCYVDVGKDDDLRVGVTFSVYRKSNSGYGRRNTEDVKGKIQIVELLGPHSSKAKILESDDSEPIAPDDPVYSPLFSSGQKLTISVAGLIDFDGNPGSDRDEFHRMVTAAGAEIDNEIGDTGEFIRGSADGVTEKTRFLIIGDLGENSSTQDATLRDLYLQIQRNTNKLKDSALEHGVYVVGLQNFLEYLGYSKRRFSYRPGIDERPPGFLPNGGKSSSVSSTAGNRESSAAISGVYATENPKQRTTSTGQVSALYK